MSCPVATPQMRTYGIEKINGKSTTRCPSGIQVELRHSSHLNHSFSVAVCGATTGVPACIGHERRRTHRNWRATCDVNALHNHAFWIKIMPTVDRTKQLKNEINQHSAEKTRL